VRVGFSDVASGYATELFDDVDTYAVTSLDSPTLPFDDDFEGPVSVGPLDWTFLRVGSPVDRLHRVVDDDGLLVFTVPTARSPSGMTTTTGRTRTRLVSSPPAGEPAAAQLFQYSMPRYSLINSLPDSIQAPFVDVADDSRRGSRIGTPGTGRPLVLGATPLDDGSSLDNGLDCRLRPLVDVDLSTPDGESCDDGLV
jgi:hypothetical protein